MEDFIILLHYKFLNIILSFMLRVFNQTNAICVLLTVNCLSLFGIDGVVTNVLTENKDSDQPDYAITFRWENDVLSDDDGNYSNGISLSLACRGRGPFGKVWDLFGVNEAEYYHSYEAGQIMNTPFDTSLPVPPLTDRPYSGLMFLGLGTQIKKGNDFHGLKFVTGVVGPMSLAKETQIWFHRVIGSDRPEGWGTQLHNEPIFNFVYEYRHRYRLFNTDSDISSDLIPIGQVMAGNVMCQGQFRMQTRIGWNVPDDDFGTTTLRGMGSLTIPKYKGSGSSRIGFYAFGGGGVRLVGRDLTLEGNSFRSSPGLDNIRNYVPVAEVGFTFYYRMLQLSASYIFSGREWDTQDHPTEYGTIALTVSF